MASLVDFYKSKLAGVGQKLTNILDRDKETPGFQITKNPVLFSRSTSEGGYKPSLALQAAGGLQNFAENKLTNIPKFTPLSSRVEKIKNPVTRFVAGVPAGFVEGVANIPGDLLSGSALVGREIGKGFDPTRNVDASQLIKGGARLGESFLNAYTLGVGKQLAEQAGKQTLKSVLKEGAKTGAKYGAAYGALGGLQDTSGGIKGQLLGAGTGAISGAAMGAAGGAVLGGGMYGIGRGVEAIAARRAAANAARNKLIDEIPRFLKPEPKWEMKASSYYQEHGEPIFKSKGKMTAQDINFINRAKQQLSPEDVPDIQRLFANKTDFKGKVENLSPEFMLKELSMHADKTGIKPGFARIDMGTSKDTPKLSVEPTGKYKIIKQEGIVEVDGTPVKIANGLDTFIHEGTGGWVVSEKSSGQYMADGRTKQEAIAKATKAVKDIGLDKVKSIIAGKQLPQSPSKPLSVEPVGGKTVFEQRGSNRIQNIGQLSPDEIKSLDKLVKEGRAIKSSEGWDGWMGGAGNIGPKKQTWTLKDVPSPLGGKVEPVGGKDLLKEARNYKSAEDFIKAQSGNQGIYDKGYEDMIKRNRASAKPFDYDAMDAIGAEPQIKGDKVKIYRLTTNGKILPGDNVSIYDVSKFVQPNGGLDITAAKMGITKLSGNKNVKLVEQWIPKSDLYQTDAGTQLYAPNGIKSLADLWNQAQSSPLGGKVGGEVPTPIRKPLKEVYGEKFSSPTGTNIAQVNVGASPSNIVKPSKELPSVLPTQPSVTSEGSLAPIISKKGKLNLEKLAVDDTGKQALQDINQGIPTSVISNKSVIEKAKTATGANKPMSDEQMQNLLAQQLKNRQQVVDLSAKFSKAKAGGASEEELGKIMLELANQSRTAQQGGTFAGRLLQAQNIIADQSASPMQKILALLDNAGISEKKYLKDAVQVDWNNPVKVVEFYRKYVPPKLGEVLTEIRYTNMLSSPLTHITNIASNALQTGFIAPIEKSITGVVDSFRSALTGKERQYYARAGVDYTKGYIGALPDAIKKASNVLSGKEISIRPDMEYLPTGVGGPLQKYTTPLRALEAMDQFFKTLVAGGVTKELQAGPKKLSVTQIASQAEKEANYRLFRQAFDPKGELGQGYVLKTFDAWNSAINGLRRLPGGKWILPFLQTPTNILKQGIEYSPLGVTTMAGARRPIEQLSKAIIGTGVFATAYQLASSGLTSWEAPSGEKERELYYAAGLQPYSIKMGDKWVSFSKLGPLSYPIAMAAALADAEKTKPDQSKIKSIGNSVGGMLGFFGDQSYVRSIGDLVDAIQGGINVGPTALTSQASNLAGQLIPYKSFLTWLGRITDPTYRKAKTFGEKLVKDIPILGSQAEPYLTPTGEPSKRDLPLVNAISPYRVTVEKKQNIPSYRKYEQGRIQRGIEKRVDEAFQQGKTTQTGKVYRYVDDAGSLKKIDVGKVTSMPTTTNYERALKDAEKWKVVDDILNLDPQDQSSALKELGVTKEDAQYYSVAKGDTIAKYAYVKDQARGATSYQDFLTKTLPLFREVNGKKIFTDAVIDELYGEGVITSAQKKQLKSIDYSGAKPKLKSGTAKVKYVKAVLPKSSLATKLPRVKRIRTKRYKLVVPKVK